MKNTKDHIELARSLRSRMLNVLPAASYQMDRFLQIVDIVVSDLSETACVEVGPQPRLHVNAKFIEKYCERDEHLFMLVLHELYHVILGHTRLFPRLTQAHNIAFDAIINSMLCHQFRDDIYLEFFRKVNHRNNFISHLLRPPKGWPEDPKEVPKNLADDEKQILTRLYGEKPGTVTYHEILEVLAKHCEESGMNDFVLLGDHTSESGDEKKVNDALFKDILRDITKDWPEVANIGTGDNSRIFDFLMPQPKSPRRQFLEELKKLLDRAGVLRPDLPESYGWKKTLYGEDCVTYMPSLRDRLAHTKGMLFGSIPFLYKSDITRMRPRWTPKDVTHIYVDISGSMDDCLPWLAAALDPLNRKGLCRLYVFSTVVDEVKKSKFLKGRFKNTGGTNINCIYEHLINKFSTSKTPRKVVVLTDGYTGTPKPDFIQEWKKRGVKLYVGLVGTCISRGLTGVAERIEHFPSIK